MFNQIFWRPEAYANPQPSYVKTEEDDVIMLKAILIRCTEALANEQRCVQTIRRVNDPCRVHIFTALTNTRAVNILITRKDRDEYSPHPQSCVCEV